MRTNNTTVIVSEAFGRRILPCAFCAFQGKGSSTLETKLFHRTADGRCVAVRPSFEKKCGYGFCCFLRNGECIRPPEIPDCRSYPEKWCAFYADKGTYAAMREENARTQAAYDAMEPLLPFGYVGELRKLMKGYKVRAAVYWQLLHRKSIHDVSMHMRAAWLMGFLSCSDVSHDFKAAFAANVAHKVGLGNPPFGECVEVLAECARTKVMDFSAAKDAINDAHDAVMGDFIRRANEAKGKTEELMLLMRDDLQAMRYALVVSMMNVRDDAYFLKVWKSLRMLVDEEMKVSKVHLNEDASIRIVSDALKKLPNPFMRGTEAGK